MPKELDSVFCVTLDVSPSLHELLEAGGVVWVDPGAKEAFMAHGWSTHDERAAGNADAAMQKHSYTLVSDDVPACAAVLFKALLSGRPVRPATLHETLALAARRHELGWWNHDFVVVGTSVNGYCPTVAIREDRPYLGVERLSSYDPPSYFLVSF